ncbi:MAG TPA: cation diffusion facilitator family transporter [Terriglobales bacterium]|nr:cation diffusion facilitator family transporter [Terriglobales bacterium]
MADSIALSAGRKNKKKLWIVFCLTTGYMLAETVGGLLTRSLALLADAGHMFTDAAALGLALFAIHFAERPATAEKTYGYLRTEILAALLNALALLLISFYILDEAWRRFQNPPAVMSTPMLIVASIGLMVNFAGMRMLSSAAGESLNAKGAYLEVLSDTLGSIGVIVASLVMLTTGWYLADPIIGAGIGLFIVPRTWSVLTDAVHILMEGVPERLDVKKIDSALRQIAGVRAVHDLHVWTLTSGLDSMSAHVQVEESADNDSVLSELQKLLKTEFQIEHTTLQLEKGKSEPEGLSI